MGEEKVEVKITIPKSLYDKIKEEADNAGFTDIEEFIRFVLEQLVESGETGEELSPEDEEKVKERLRALGYID